MTLFQFVFRVALLLVAASASASAQPAQPPLVLYGDANLPPISWLDKGVPRGLGVEIAQAVAVAMGRELDVRLMDWAEAQERVRAGEADGLLNMTYSQERAQVYDFSEPTLARDYSIFIRADGLGIGGIKDLAGKRVGVTLAGLPRSILTARGGSDLVIVESYADAFARLAAGTLDAVAADHWAAAYAIQQQGLGNIRLAGPPFTTSPASITVRRGDPLLPAISRAVRALHDDGTIRRIEAQWKPQQVVFMTVEQQQRWIALGVGAILVVVLIGLGVWIVTLKKHIRGRRAAEQARADADQRLRLAISAADMGTWHWDAPTDQTTRDANLNRMLGLPAEETTAFRSELLARVHPDDAHSASEGLLRSAREQSPYAVEYRIIRPDGTIRWLREAGRTFVGASGDVAYATGVVMDVTAERAMAEALRRSEERFSRAFQTSPDCLAISDVNGIVVDVNDRFEEITGHPKAYILNRRMIDTDLLVDPRKYFEFMEQMAANGVVREFEYEIHSRAGVRRTIQASAELFELDGRPHILAVHRDITAHKLAEEALRHTEARYRDLVENANDIIFTVDRDGYCLSMNRIGQLLTGYVADDARGTNLRKLVAPEQLPMVLHQLDRVMKGEDIAPFEIDVLTADGRRIALEVGVRPVREGDSIVAAQGIARDVTTRRELEAQLRQAQKMDAIGRLAAGVAHDFNNLLTIILGHTETSAPLVRDGGPLQHAMMGIRNAADRAASLTRQLLAFSRRQVTQPRALDLNTVVADIKVMMSRLIGEDIAVQFRPGDHLWTVNADASQVQQVVLNLAVNARDAMPRGGDLIIETKNVMLDGYYVQHHAQVPAGEYVMISVTDSGIGMDQETLAHIFEPFFTTKEVGKGTGLGLATVYGIVKQSNGFIWVYSEVGIGSTFKVYLPRSVESRPLPPLAKVNDERTGDETVLLVEDETELRDILESYLASRGYTVLSAGDGLEGLEVCRRQTQPPRLLITDVVMPGMSGRALADQLRQEHPSMKVLYLSGYTDDAVLRHGILPNDTHFLQKPFALHDLAAKVRTILDSPQAAP